MTALAPPDLPRTATRAERLRDPLIDEWRAAPATRKAPARLLAVAALSALIAVTAFAVTRDADPALAVERHDGWLVLRIADVSAGEAELTRELRDAGIAGEVKLLPVPADLVGAWAIISEHADPPGTARSLEPGPRQTVRLDRVRYERETLRIPIAEVRESSGYFVFYAGREGRPGEELFRDGDLQYRR